MTIHEYLKPRLLDPLGIKDVIWEMDNDGINMGNGGSHMHTSDMAKMGLFLINKGKWNGKQLLNAAWIEAATTPHIFQHPERTAEENEKVADDGSQGYGYQIWMGRRHSYRAIGGQNQLIMVIPGYDFVLVCHSRISDEAGFNSLIYDMLPSMSKTKLSPNKIYNLKAEVSKYELKKPFPGPSADKVVTSTRRYKMEENPAGINSLLFRFDGSGNCHLTFVTSSAIHNIPFGLDSWLYGMTDRTLSIARTVYPNPMDVTPVHTAGMCSWTSNNQLSAYYLSMFNPGSDETMRFTFDGDQVIMEIVAPTGPKLGPPTMEKQELKNIVIRGSKM